MSVEEKLEELTKLLEKHIKEDDVVHAEVKEMQKAPKRDWTRLIGVAVTLLVLGAGIITSWASTSAAVEGLQKQQTRIEKRQDKVDVSLHDVQLKAVSEATDLKSVKEDVSEIKKDVKELVKELLKR